MRVLITGAEGQLGRELVRSSPDGVEVVPLSRASCDISDSASVKEVFEEHKPEILLNSAAYTAVDQAETDTDAAFAVNARGVEHLARAAKAWGTRLIHISTDYVFDGTSTKPYTVRSPTAPINVYGATKLQGELYALELDQLSLVIRTSWLYSAWGKNFLLTMLRAMRDRRPLRVVTDQTGGPTSATDLAATIWRCAFGRSSGLHHWANSGAVTWFQFAIAIQEMALSIGLLPTPSEITPVATSEYPTRAKRPRYSVLETSEIFGKAGHPREWKAPLSETISQIDCLLRAAKLQS